MREQLTQAQQAQAERDKLQALLEKNGIDPSVDPDDISQEELEQLAQDYPDLGKALMAVASKLDKLEPQAAPQQVRPVAAPAGPSQLITHTLHLIGCLMIQLFKVSAYKKAILYLLLHKKVDMTEPSLNGYYS